MKIAIMGFEKDIEFNDQVDSLLIIEDKPLYAKVVGLLNALSLGKDATNEIILKDEDKNIGFKNTIVIIDPFNIDLNSRKIISGLYSSVSGIIGNDDILNSEFKKKNQEILSLLFDSIDELNIDFEYNQEISVSEYLKGINLKVAHSYNEKIGMCILNYLEIISEIMPKTIIFFCNILAYLNNKEIMEMCKYKNYKHLQVLFIENEFTGSYDFRRNIIDRDYEEHVL